MAHAKSNGTWKRDAIVLLPDSMEKFALSTSWSLVPPVKPIDALQHVLQTSQGKAKAHLRRVGTGRPVIVLV